MGDTLHSGQVGLDPFLGPSSPAAAERADRPRSRERQGCAGGGWSGLWGRGQSHGLPQKYDSTLPPERNLRAVLRAPEGVVTPAPLNFVAVASLPKMLWSRSNSSRATCKPCDQCDGEASNERTNRKEFCDVPDSVKPEKIQKTEAEWRKLLTPEQFHVMREKGSERPLYRSSPGQSRHGDVPLCVL